MVTVGSLDEKDTRSLHAPTRLPRVNPGSRASEDECERVVAEAEKDLVEHLRALEALRKHLRERLRPATCLSSPRSLVVPGNSPTAWRPAFSGWPFAPEGRPMRRAFSR